MKGFIKKKDSKFQFHLISIILICIVIPSTLFLRKRKDVVLNNLYEDLIIRTPGISSIANLLEKNLSPDATSNKTKLFYLTKYFSKLPFANKNLLKESYYHRKNLPDLNIIIPFNEYEIILNDRIKSIKKGFLKNPSWAKGKIRSKDNTNKIRVRLKGDLGDHWLSNKRTSFRIRLRKGDKNSKAISGMKEFSLHKLRSRQYPYDYLFSDLVSVMGFPSVKHKIVNVTFNNENWGVMDMQEHFGTTLLERNKLKDSSIYRFSDDNYWLLYEKDNESIIPRKDFWLSNPRIFFSLLGTSKKELNQVKLNEYFYVSKVLKQDNYQEILFNQNSLSEIQEILNIWGNFHSITNGNARFYFNPFTLKLEPIMADQGRFQKIDVAYPETIFSVTNGFLKPKNLSFADKTNLHNKTLDNLKNLTPYQTSEELFPLDQKLDLTIPLSNYNFLKNNNSETLNSKYEKKHIYQDRLICSNNNLKGPKKLPILYSYYDENNISITPLLCGKIIVKEFKICNKKKKLNQIINPSVIRLDNPIKINLEDNKFLCERENNYLKYEYLNEEYKVNLEFKKNVSLSINPLLDTKFPNFIKKESNNKYILRKGNWKIIEPIFLKGDLEIEKGTNLKFAKGTYLFIEGNIKVNGTKTNPVNMISLNKEDKWKGIYVFNYGKNKNKSIIKNLFVNNTEETDTGLLDLTGGITFYNNEVIIDGLHIENSIAEDSLNIVKSKITVSNLIINNSKSDGFDCDFCIGEINNVSLNQIGGDGLDFSGSKLVIDNVSGNGIKDKVVSIGEESKIDLEIIDVKNSYLAVAIKDGSQANVDIFDVKTTGPIVMAYNKKSFYDKKTLAKINYKNINLINKELFITSPDAQLTVNGENISPINLDIKYMYQQGPMKKN